MACLRGLLTNQRRTTGHGLRKAKHLAVDGIPKTQEVDGPRGEGFCMPHASHGSPCRAVYGGHDLICVLERPLRCTVEGGNEGRGRGRETSQALHTSGWLGAPQPLPGYGTSKKQRSSKARTAHSRSYLASLRAQEIRISTLSS